MEGSVWKMSEGTSIRPHGDRRPRPPFAQKRQQTLCWTILTGLYDLKSGDRSSDAGLLNGSVVEAR